MKGVDPLFAPTRGQAAAKFCHCELFQGTLRGRRGAEHDHLNAGGNIDRCHPHDRADGPHFDDDLAWVRAFSDHVASRDSVPCDHGRFNKLAQCAAFENGRFGAL
jgi:hypothetical protein